MDGLSFKLSDFEGPLDLLLYLISKHKLDILNISIGVLLEQYTDYVNRACEEELEVKSEFIEMAARLVYIKTVSLLPRHEDETAKLKGELAGGLMEYSLCRQAAANLGERAAEFAVFARLPMKVDVDMTYRLTHPASVLAAALADAADRAKDRAEPDEGAFNPIVRRPVVPVGARIVHLLRRFYAEPTLRIDEIFKKGERSELVATFLALLELLKAGRVVLSDGGDEVSFVSSAGREES